MISLDDLNQAMRDPARGVPAIRRLGGGSLAITASDDPWCVVGRASAMYALRRPTGRILALRVPLDDDPAALTRLADRYRGIATDPALAALRVSGGPLPGEIHWLPDGITLPAAGFRSIAHPLLAMEYVPGGTLAAAVDEAGAASEKSTIAALATSLAAVLVIFEQIRFGHGDLRPDNIMLRGPRELVFVDLDRAAWPGAPGLPLGADPPARDRLPALLLLTELLALAWKPELRHGAVLAEGRLLFGPDDLADPPRSPLLRQMLEADDPTLAAIAVMAADALSRGAPGVPPISEVVAAIGLGPDLPAGRLHHPGAPLPTAPPRGAHSSDGGTPERPGAPVGLPGWRPRTGPAAPLEAAAIGAAPSSDGWPSPVGEPPPVASAANLPAEGSAPLPLSPGERQKTMTRLNALLLAGDAEAAGRYWLDSGLAVDPVALREVGPRLRSLGLSWAPPAVLDPIPDRDVPLESDIAPPAVARPTVGPSPPPAASAALPRLLAALEAGDIGLVADQWPTARGDPRAGLLAARVDGLLTRDLMNRARRAERLNDDAALARLPVEAAAVAIPLPEETRRAARDAADREDRRARLARAVAAPDRSALVELALAGLADLGRLPADVVTAIDRAKAWPTLERALATEQDAGIVAAADPALFADDPLLSAAARQRIELAYARTTWLRTTRTALRQRDGAALRAALGSMPPAAAAGLSPTERRRIDRLARADAAMARLAEALKAGSDTAIVDALGVVEATGATLPATLDWQAIQSVADRVALVRALHDVAEGDPADALRLARLLPAARALLAESPGSEPAGFDLAALEQRVLRAAHLARLREAIAGGDDAAMAAAAHPDPYGAIELLAPVERHRLTAALGASVAP